MGVDLDESARPGESEPHCARGARKLYDLGVRCRWSRERCCSDATEGQSTLKFIMSIRRWSMTRSSFRRAPHMVVCMLIMISLIIAVIAPLTLGATASAAQNPTPRLRAVAVTI